MKTTTDNTKAALFRAAASALIAALCGCAQPTSSGSRNTTENATTIEVGVTSGASTLADAIAMANGGTAASYTIIINDSTLPPTTLGPTLSASAARLNLAGPLFADSGVTRTIALQAKDSTGAGAAVALRLAEGEAGSVFTVKAGAALKLGKGVKIADAAGNTAPLLTVAGELDMKAGGALAAVSGNTALHLTGKLNIAGESVIEGKVYDAGELTIGGSALIKGELYVAPDRAVKIDGTLTPSANPQADGMTTAVTSIVAPVKEGAAAPDYSGLAATVEKPAYKAVSSISLSRTAYPLAEGGTVTLTASVVPADATNRTVVWTASNPAVATVKDGLVTWKGAGTATITATADGLSARCTVTCEASSALPPEAPASVTFIMAFAPDTSKTTDAVRLVFNTPVELDEDDITITPNGTGAKADGLKKADVTGRIYDLEISGVKKSGKIKIKAESDDAGISPAEQEAQVYFVDNTPPPPDGVKLVAAFALDKTRTTGTVRLVFSEAVPLTKDDIDIEDEEDETGAEIEKLTKIGDGLIYDLEISGVKKSGTIKIKVDSVEEDGLETEVYFGYAPRTDIQFVAAFSTTDSTRTTKTVRLVFNEAVVLTATDITITDTDGTGAVKYAVSGASPVPALVRVDTEGYIYDLHIKSIKAAGGIAIGAAKTGLTFTPASKTAEIYYIPPVYEGITIVTDPVDATDIIKGGSLTIEAWCAGNHPTGTEGNDPPIVNQRVKIELDGSPDGVTLTDITISGSKATLSVESTSTAASVTVNFTAEGDESKTRAMTFTIRDPSASERFATALAGAESVIEVTGSVETASPLPLIAGRTITISGNGLLTIAADFTAIGSIVVENSGTGTGITIASGKTLTLGTLGALFKGSGTAGVTLGGVLKADGEDSSLYANETGTEIGVSGSLRSPSSISLENGSIRLAAGKTITLGTSGVAEMVLLHGTGESLYTAMAGTLPPAKKVTLTFDTASKMLTADGNGALLRLRASGSEIESGTMKWANMNFPIDYKLVIKDGTTLEAAGSSGISDDNVSYSAGFNFNPVSGDNPLGMRFNQARAEGGDATITATATGARMSGSAAGAALWIGGEIAIGYNQKMEFPATASGLYPLTIKCGNAATYATAEPALFLDIKTEGAADITCTAIYNTQANRRKFSFSNQYIGDYAAGLVTGNLTISVYGNASGTPVSMGSINLGGSGTNTAGKIVLVGGSSQAKIRVSCGADGGIPVISTGNGAGTAVSFKSPPATVGTNLIINGSSGLLANITRGTSTSAAINTITGSTTADFEISSRTEVE
jgi:hypothetical protein